MKQFVAMVVYRAVVAGEPTGSLDIQARFYLGKSENDVRKAIEEEESQVYSNSDSELVVWERRKTMAVEEFSIPDSGDEIVGFVAKLAEFEQLA